MNKWYPWLNIPYRQLIKQYTHSKRKNCLIIHTKLGKYTNVLISRLIRWIFCTKSNSEKNCGKCRSCFLMKFGNHPDYHILSKEKDNGSIDIEILRNVRKKLYTNSKKGGVKFVFFFYSNTRTDNASHEFIKILEEPPEKTYFLLSLCEEDNFFRTLRKRFIYLHLYIPEKIFLLKWLSICKKKSFIIHNEMLTALYLNDQSPIEADHFLKKDILRTRNKICKIFNKGLLTHNMICLIDFLKNKYIEQIFYWLSTLFLDAIKFQNESENYIINTDKKKIITYISKVFNKKILHKILHNFFYLHYTFKNIQNINRIIITEQLLILEQCIKTAFFNG